MRKRKKPTIQPRNVSHFRDLQQETARRLGQNLETIIDNANVWFNAQDKEGKVLFWNKGAEEISGYSREEVMGLGRTWERLIYPDEEYRREVLKRESALLEDGTDDAVMETRIRCKDGQTKTISWRSRNLRDEKGNLVGSFALVLDVTEQKQAEEALRRRAIQLQAIGEVGRRVSSILKLDELLSYVVKAIQQSFGYYHVDIFLVDEVQDFVVFKASSISAFEKIWKKRHRRFKIGEEGMIGWVARSGRSLLANDVDQESHYVSEELLPDTKSELVVPLKVEERIVGVLDVDSDKLDAFDDDDIFVLEALANQLAIAIENARLYREAQQEIAARRHIEEALRESEERFRTLFENLAIGVYRTSPDGRIVLANPALVRMLGYASFEELADRNLEEVGFEPEYPRKLFKQRMEKEGQIVGLESAWVRHDGSTLFVRESARTVRDAHGETLYHEGTVEDITARKQTENALQESRNELERRVEERTAELKNVNSDLQREVAERKQMEDQLRTLNARHKRAVTIVSHELSTPLTSIRGYADLLSAGRFGPISVKQQEILDGIMRNSQRLATLVDAFLNLERIEAGTLCLDRSHFHLEDLLVDVEEMHQLTAQENGLRLQADFGSEMRMYADRAELAQVFSNLVSNALKFSDSGTVLIGARSNGGQVMVEVVDQGQGIPEQDLPFIFDEFYQGQPTSSGKRSQGIGLGLSIARKIVRAHQGTIQVKSRVGEGSTFTVTLPLAEEPAEPRENS